MDPHNVYIEMERRVQSLSDVDVEVVNAKGTLSRARKAKKKGTYIEYNTLNQNQKEPATQPFLPDRVFPKVNVPLPTCHFQNPESIRPKNIKNKGKGNAVFVDVDVGCRYECKQSYYVMYVCAMYLCTRNCDNYCIIYFIHHTNVSIIIIYYFFQE